MTENEEAKVSIVEITDPICSIAWGMEPKRRLLEWRYGQRINWRTSSCGLIADLSKADEWGPGMTKQKFGQGYLKVWATVSKLTGMPYPAKLQHMAMTTVISCKAIKAAENQGELVRNRVLRRFREQVFIYGAPVDNADAIEAALQGIPDLNLTRLLTDLNSEQVEQAFQQDWLESRTPNAYVKRLAAEGIERLKGPSMSSEGHERYALPTFIVSGPCGEVTIPGWRDYAELESAIEQVLPGFIKADDRTNPSPEEAFCRWNSMTEQELKFICGTTEVPTDIAQSHQCGNSKIWLNPLENEYWQSKQQSIA